MIRNVRSEHLGCGWSVCANQLSRSRLISLKQASKPGKPANFIWSHPHCCSTRPFFRDTVQYLSIYLFKMQSTNMLSVVLRQLTDVHPGLKGLLASAIHLSDTVQTHNIVTRGLSSFTASWKSSKCIALPQARAALPTPVAASASRQPWLTARILGGKRQLGPVHRKATSRSSGNPRAPLLPFQVPLP